MGKLNLVLVDKDLDYLKGLTNYLRLNHGDEFYIVTISEKDYFSTFLDSNRPIDILIMASQFFCEKIYSKDINTTIIFGERTDTITTFKDFKESIQKYQSGEVIYNQIIGIYKKRNPRYKKNMNFSAIDCKVMSIFSPIGGIGKTSIAVSMSLLLAKMGKSVLYLNFEDIPSTGVFFETSGKEHNMSNFLYAVKDRLDNTKEIFNNNIVRDDFGVYYFNPVNSVLDIEELSFEDIGFMIENIKAMNIFNYVIVDLSSKFNSMYSSIFRNSDKIIFPIGQDNISKIKVDNISVQIDSFEKFIFIMNKYRQEQKIEVPEYLIKEKKPIIYKISYDSSIAQNLNSRFEICSNNVFSLEVYKLLQKII